MNSIDIKIKLNALGSEGALDTLDCVKMMGKATASEVAKELGTHIATSVKRLNMLYEAGFLDRKVRRGKTRSAQEYSLITTKIILELDLERGTHTNEIATIFLGSLLHNILTRLLRFGGRTLNDVLHDWKNVSAIDDGIITWLESGGQGSPPCKQEILLESISKILAAEADEYGELTVRALARASLSAVGSSNDIVKYELPSRFFGGD